MPREWFNLTDEDDTIEIDIYGPIGRSWWDDSYTSAKDILDTLKDSKDKDVIIHVNSEGGSVFDAFAIYTQLRQHNGKVTAYVDGLAASAASYLIAAADEVVMSDVAWLMIHNASTLISGNKEDIRKEANLLENIDNTIASIYATRSGHYSIDHFLELMKDETWLSAADAATLGLIDTISQEQLVAAHLDYYSVNSLDHAPSEAKAAISKLLGDKVNDCDPAKLGEENGISDTLENMQPDDDSQGQESALADQTQERSFVVMNGKVYSRKVKDESQTDQGGIGSRTRTR